MLEILSDSVIVVGQEILKVFHGCGGGRTFLGLGVKYSRWGKNALDGVKIHNVGTSGTVKYAGSNS